MKPQRLLGISIAVSVGLMVLLGSLTFWKMSEVQKELTDTIVGQQAELDDLQASLDSNVAVLQNLIKNVDQADKDRQKELLELITQVELEGKAAVEEARQELEKNIANIEVTGGDFSKVAQESLESVVSVLTDVGQGSGAFISSDEIVTNFHVIQGATKVNVLAYDNEVYPAIVVGYNSVVDIALLRVENVSYPSLALGNSDTVKVGEAVVALGNPYGLDFSVTQGIISAKRTASNGITYLQIDVPINPGNSGGPVVDAAGDIVGLANFRIQGAEGLGFAIPSNLVKETIMDIT
ncbi:MAG TPA: trypsin-like peptidase domain-containing protein [Candidatus Nanoarchaeia archaeon]|nr:trypsin-like peptidase domain-containing protein [Candidatus Nanoarchaeia archaeon]